MVVVSCGCGCCWWFLEASLCFFFLCGGSFLWLWLWLVVVGLRVGVVGLLRLVMGLVEIDVGDDGVVVVWWWVVEREKQRLEREVRNIFILF